MAHVACTSVSCPIGARRSRLPVLLAACGVVAACGQSPSTPVPRSALGSTCLPDTVSPQVTSLVLSTPVVDVTNGRARVYVDAVVRDLAISGRAPSGVVALTAQLTRHEHSVTVRSLVRLEPTVVRAHWHGSFVVPTGAAPGRWVLGPVHVVDAAGNDTAYGGWTRGALRLPKLWGTVLEVADAARRSPEHRAVRHRRPRGTAPVLRQLRVGAPVPRADGGVDLPVSAVVAGSVTAVRVTARHDGGRGLGVASLARGASAGTWRGLLTVGRCGGAGDYLVRVELAEPGGRRMLLPAELLRRHQPSRVTLATLPGDDVAPTGRVQVVGARHLRVTFDEAVRGLDPALGVRDGAGHRVRVRELTCLTEQGVVVPCDLADALVRQVEVRLARPLRDPARWRVVVGPDDRVPQITDASGNRLVAIRRLSASTVRTPRSGSR